MTEQSYYNNSNNGTGQGDQSQNQNHAGGGAFSFLYRTRIKVDKGNTPILNLSLIFSILAVVSAPWLAVAGLIVALVLGYRFSIEKNAKGFADNFQDVVRGAAGNVKAAVDSVVKEEDQE